MITQQADLTKKVVFCFICLGRVPILPAQLVDLADCRATLLLEFVQGRQQYVHGVREGTPLKGISQSGLRHL